jgi:UDP-N-acetylglucosamine 2-epimerase (non-hydrolysing)
MKLAIIVGTRPEIIKMSPVIRAAKERELDFFVLHTGQHYSKELDEQIFVDLELDVPRYNLGSGGQPYRQQIGLMIREMMKVFEHEKPDIVIVQGDTTSVLAGALAANRLNIKVAHHEAGLRSHDLSMPEETNRILTDHVSDVHFVPTVDARKALEEEGIVMDNVSVSGNTIVDAVLQNIEFAERKSVILTQQSLVPKQYILVTAHRAENVDNEDRLRGIVSSLAAVASEFMLPVIFPMHPRTHARIREFGIDIPKEIQTIEPLGFLDFLQLERHARLVITDSGGVQEECLILHVPCVTLRENTERPETVELGVNIIAGTEPARVLGAAKIMFAKEHMFKDVINPYGDGRAGEMIIDALMRYHKGTPE